jgi:hypothetical protein
LAKKRLSTGEIAKELGRERNNVGVHLFNQLGNAWKTRDDKPVSLEEAYARKIANVLRLPLDRARQLARGEGSTRRQARALPRGGASGEGYRH